MDVNSVIDIRQNATNKHLPNTNKSSMSTEEFETIEVSRSSLWKLSWKAIHDVTTTSFN